MPGWLRPLSACCGVALAWLTLTAGAAPYVDVSEQGDASAKPRVTFHHLHLVSGQPDQLADFYHRLFVSGAVSRGLFWNIEGIRGNGNGVFLLVSGNVSRRRDTATGLWHFGWGTGTVRESLNQTYAEHYATDVNWRPPYETLVKGFHLHLLSSDPVAAGQWYADVLGGEIEKPPRNEDSRRDGREILPTDITSEPPRVAVSFGDIVLYIHQAVDPLVSSRDAGLVDHIAFSVKDLPSLLLRVPADNTRASEAGTSGSNAANETFGLKEQRTAMIIGPDKVVIELVQQPKGPGFWLDRP
jgi:catechol 2,3-dioxygenase-like lactoylglutathione lyase family enzyme